GTLAGAGRRRGTRRQTVLTPSPGRAPGSAPGGDSPTATPKRGGSASEPRSSPRHMAGRAGGRSSVEDIELRSRLAVIAEARGLQLEHRAIATARRHQLVVRAELHHLAALQHA